MLSGTYGRFTVKPRKFALLFALALENLLANKFYRQSEANG